jgi:excisionase family DNA binding protein
MRPVDRSKVRRFSTEASVAPGPAEYFHGNRKLAYSVSEFSKLSNLSRSLLYEAIKLGELQSIKVRGRRLILAEDGKNWLLSFRDAV